MCPEPQLLSIYMDGELPSPWKEKMESHLTECSMCREKLENFRGLFNRTNVLEEQRLMEEAKDKVWKKFQSRRPMQRFRSSGRNYSVWQRKLSIPLPAAAAAAVAIVFLAAVWVNSSSSVKNNAYANNAYANLPVEASEKTIFNIASEERIPSAIPTADLDSVLQYLGAERSEIIILQLPESGNFFRAGEPAIIRAADYNTRR